MIKLVGALILFLCVLVSVLRGLGVMSGDFIVPLILLSQLFILGYMYNLLQIVSKDIILRYNINMNQKNSGPDLHTWN